MLRSGMNLRPSLRAKDGLTTVFITKLKTGKCNLLYVCRVRNDHLSWVFESHVLWLLEPFTALNSRIENG